MRVREQPCSGLCVQATRGLNKVQQLTKQVVAADSFGSWFHSM